LDFIENASDVDGAHKFILAVRGLRAVPPCQLMCTIELQYVKDSRGG
jgi:hypothetical protein